MVGKFREFCCLSLLYLMCPPGAGAQDRLVQEYIEIASNAVTSVESLGSVRVRHSEWVPAGTIEIFKSGGLSLYPPLS
jgi:hypothetical protein